MPALVRLIAAHGDRPIIRTVPCDAESIAGADGCQPGSGVYAAFATNRGLKVVRLTAHFDRLEDSAKRIGLDVSIDRDLVCRELRTIAQESGYGEVKMRLVWDPSGPEAEMLSVAMEPYPGPPVHLLKTGVRCETVSHVARANALAKQAGWLTARKTFHPSREPAPFEYILVDEGRMLEGSSSNFYAVFGSENPTLVTAGDHVLAGITRSVVLEVAQEVAKVDLRSPLLSEVPRMTEAFLTSSTREVVPIVAIDGAAIGDGKPGPTTLAISKRFQARSIALEEPL